MKKIKVGILGLGRIGKIHLGHLTGRIKNAEVVAAMNRSAEGLKFATDLGVPLVSTDASDILDNPDIDAVIVCSPTDTHADYVLRAARNGKAVFCEKPLDLSRAKVKEVLQETAKLKTHLMMGFNQRFDNNFSNVNKQVRSGKIGDIHTLHIISRDPAPPPVSYILSSGGLFMDMSIHDFDMARFIMGSEVVEVFAKGYNLVDPEIGKAGDIDTAVVLLTFKNKATAIIENSRKAVYGYDQRLEVFGSAGMIKVENPLKDQSICYNEEGGQSARHLDFFMDRYLDSYVKEMDAFIQSILNNKPVPVTGEDALKAMNIAEAANLSVKENRPVSLV